jgi:hypothetical protein
MAWLFVGSGLLSELVMGCIPKCTHWMQCDGFLLADADGGDQCPYTMPVSGLEYSAGPMNSAVAWCGTGLALDRKPTHAHLRASAGTTCTPAFPPHILSS